MSQEGPKVQRIYPHFVRKEGESVVVRIMRATSKRGLNQTILRAFAGHSQTGLILRVARIRSVAPFMTTAKIWAVVCV